MDGEHRAILEQYDAVRRFDNKAFRSACYAPYLTLLFDTKGFVRACCQSMTHSYGNITRQSLSEIWHGKNVSDLRKQLKGYDFPTGCATCALQIEQGNHDISFSRIYDDTPVPSERPEWPVQMEFLLSNTCNLQCVQCFGELSSSIRKHRDKLPPIPRVYGDEFFEDLRSFLPHLESAVFLGGEAFLGHENNRIWNMMIEDGLRPNTLIITNGTVFSARVERVLDSLPVSISLSLDGATKEGVEAIRQGSHFETVMENIHRFLDYARERGTDFTLSFCLMPQNQHEFADFLMLAESLDCGVSVNTVNNPLEFSLNRLSKAELHGVIEGWERRDHEVRRALRRHLPTWELQLSRLRNLYRHPVARPEASFFATVSLVLRNESATPPPDRPGALPILGAGSSGVAPGPNPGPLSQWATGSPIEEFIVNTDDRVVSAETGTAGFTPEEVVGRSVTDLLMMLRERYGHDAEVIHEHVESGRMDRITEFVDLDGRRTSVRWVATAREGGEDREFLVRSGILSDPKATAAVDSD